VAKVLIVEDNSTNLSLMDYLLRAFGHTTMLASDGAVGLELALNSVPDVVLMDLQMPTMDGFEACERMRAQDRLQHIPIVAVTASAMVGERAMILSRCFDGYIAKPITPETFVAQVERFLKPDRQGPKADPGKGEDQP